MKENRSLVKLGFTDLNGILRGKIIASDKIKSALADGLGFCDIVMCSDIAGVTTDNFPLSGHHSGIPDVPLHLIEDTLRSFPLEDTPLYLGELKGKSAAICPRTLLREQVEKARHMGFEVLAGIDYEFTLLEETTHSLQEKGFKNLTYVTPGVHNSSLQHTGIYNEFFNTLFEACNASRCPIESMHTEQGPSLMEAALEVSDAISAADRAVLFKLTAKLVAQKFGWTASFMAKLNEVDAGQSGHVHLSLRTSDGQSVFYEESDPLHMSATMKRFIAGQLKWLPEVMPMLAPTTNAYARLGPAHWAPLEANWGVDNRVAAVRLVQGGPNSHRCEYRIPGADSNPYLSMAAALASGLAGIEQKLELPEPIAGNAFNGEGEKIPSSLSQATEAFKTSTFSKESFGEGFVENYAALREWELRAYDKSVTDWELARYLETV